MYYIEESLKFCHSIMYIHCTNDSETQEVGGGGGGLMCWQLPT